MELVIGPLTIPLSRSGGTSGLDAAAVRTLIEGYVGESDLLTVSANQSTTLNPGQKFSKWTQPVLVNAGTGSYTLNLTLSNANPVRGASYRIYLEVAASENPTVNVKNAAGAILRTVVGDAGQQQYLTLVCEFNGTVWEFHGTEAAG